MKRFKNILCIVDTKAEDNIVLDHAVKLATNNQARLTVVEIIDDTQANEKSLEGIFSLESLQKKLVTDHENTLQELISPWVNKMVINHRVLTGILFLEIIREVLRDDYDLVFKMSDSGGLLNRVFGSDDMHLLRKCPCPVWLVKPKSPKTYKRILAAVDVNDFYPLDELNTRHLLNHLVLEIASSLALSESAEIHAVYSWEAIGENVMNLVFHDTPEEKVAAYVEEVRQQYWDSMVKLIHDLADYLGPDAMNYINIQRHLVKGYPRKEIPVFAQKIKADLVVMGTVARTGIPGLFMGNTAESILSQLDCSVLAIKPPGFVTPVTLN